MEFFYEKLKKDFIFFPRIINKDQNNKYRIFFRFLKNPQFKIFLNY